MRRILKAILLPLLCVSMLAGCADERKNLTPAAQWTAVGLGYEIVKTKIERRLEMTCNPLNILSDGTYCVSNYKPSDRQEVYCFKTLGGVDCYAEPDPYSLEGRQLPAQPRALADPRMPMTPPGRRTPPPQVATAPMGSEQMADPAMIEPASADKPERPAAGATEMPAPKAM